MEINGSRLVQAELPRVWRGLTDPAVLRLCIPGCESIEKVSDHEYVMAVGVSVGPVRARFIGKLFLTELNRPHTYRLGFEGEGDAVGFAKAAADVTLATSDLGTILTYRVTTQIGGILAQVVPSLIDSTARMMVDEFFEKFNNALISHDSATEPQLAGEIRSLSVNKW